MHAVPIAQSEASSIHQAPQLVELTAQPVAVPAAESSAEAEAELRRWFVFLGIPFALASLFFMGAIGTGQLWLIGGVLFTGPGLMIMAFISLALGSDTNGDT